MNPNPDYWCATCQLTLRRRGRRVLLLVTAALVAGVALGRAVPR